ncbi:MAG TPA: hypothetical protein VFB59_02685, partial [Candidatus Saccharimonadales bacterium]|nr:hypothetical protein [Candidatus Saccharimonadales bacterium]
ELYDDLYVQEMPSSTKIADLRFLLSISESLDQAPQHPDIVLVPALYQAAHLPFLNNLQTELFFFYFTGKITEEQWNNAEAVMEGPFEQFNGFLLLAPFLALTLMAYNEISKDAVSNPRHTQTMTEDALAWAGMTFIKSKLLMTRFSDTETAICPARQHIHHAIRSGLFIKLYRSIIANKDQPTIKKLLTIAQDSAHSAVHHQTYNYRRFKGGPSAKRYDGKENSILAMAERHEATQASQKRA